MQAQIAGKGHLHTLDDTAEVPGHPLGCHLAIQVAGTVVVEDDAGTSLAIPFEVGNVQIPLHDIKRIKTTGTATVRGNVALLYYAQVVSRI